MKGFFIFGYNLKSSFNLQFIVAVILHIISTLRDNYIPASQSIVANHMQQRGYSR